MRRTPSGKQTLMNKPNYITNEQKTHPRGGERKYLILIAVENIIWVWLHFMAIKLIYLRSYSYNFKWNIQAQPGIKMYYYISKIGQAINLGMLRTLRSLS